MIDEIREKQQNLQAAKDKRAEQATLKKAEQVRQIKQRFQKQDAEYKACLRPRKYG